jgi:ankyrin repeat protein
LFGSADIVNLLIAAGANVNATDLQNVKIMDKAKKLGRENIIKLLEAAGAKATEAKPVGEASPDGEQKPVDAPKTEEPKPEQKVK